MDRIDTTPTDETQPSVNRRSLMGRIGAGAATAVALGAVATGGAALTSAPAQAQAITTADVLNFALNLEYLEAEFYLRAATGQGLAAGDATGVGASGGPLVNGGVTGGSLVPFRSPAIQAYATRIAVDEQAHVRFLRAVLGSAAVARPQIDLDTAFTTLAVAAGLIVPGQRFNPFADDVSFLLGAFIFEDVGVTAYGGAARLLSGDALEAAAAILAVEAYHAGSIRTLLANIGAGVAVNRIAALRATLSGAADDIGITTPTNNYNVTPTDINALTFRRSPQQVLRIVYGVPNAGVVRGLFFPNGVNGALRST